MPLFVVPYRHEFPSLPGATSISRSSHLPGTAGKSSRGKNSRAAPASAWNHVAGFDLGLRQQPPGVFLFGGEKTESADFRLINDGLGLQVSPNGILELDSHHTKEPPGLVCQTAPFVQTPLSRLGGIDSLESQMGACGFLIQPGCDRTAPVRCGCGLAFRGGRALERQWQPVQCLVKT